MLADSIALDIEAFYMLGAALQHVFFFFQAEDGIRDLTVTGVQTCALPISYMARAIGPPEEESDPQASHPARPCRVGRGLARPARPGQPKRSRACVSSASYIRRFGRNASAQGRVR